MEPQFAPWTLCWTLASPGPYNLLVADAISRVPRKSAPACEPTMHLSPTKQGTKTFDAADSIPSRVVYSHGSFIRRHLSHA